MTYITNVKLNNISLEQIFYDNLYKLVKNLIAESKNISYNSSTSSHDMVKYFNQKGMYILEEMENTKHLINL